MTKSFLLAATFTATVLVGPASAALCSASFVNSVIARMNSIQATSGPCRTALRENAPQTCNVCRATYANLASLRATYKANKGCFKSSPQIMGRVTQLLSYRSDIKKLRKLCS